jgi:hypothetical protein
MAVYDRWIKMHQRCNNPENPNYKDYGGRGITVCGRWNDPVAFLSDMGHPKPGESLGRIDNSKGYSPDNCRWETQAEQNENTRRNRYLTWRGKTQIIKAWAKEYDISPARLSERIRRGWDIERALTTPCPKGYERGRAEHIANATAMWAKNGRRYAANSAAKAAGA